MPTVMKKTMQQVGKVQPMSNEVLRVMQQESLLQPVAQNVQYSEVANSIIRLRDFFADAVFVINPHEAPQYYMFVLATQRPFKLILRHLERRPEPPNVQVRTWKDWEEGVMAEKSFCFAHATDCATPTDMFADTSAEYVGVIMCTFYVSVDEIHSRDRMMPLLHCLESLQGEMKPVSSTDVAAGAKPRVKPVALDLQRPWLQQLGVGVAKRQRSAVATEEDQSDTAVESVDDRMEEDET
eukprot:2155863-Amphidinium_carterae.1